MKDIVTNYVTATNLVMSASDISVTTTQKMKFSI